MSEHTSAAAPDTRVWDILVRLFHWSLVAAFAVAWLTEDDFETLHQWAGYCVAGLLTFRIMWGLIGTRYARFTQFIYSPARIKRYLRSLLSAHPEHYMGHNPAGGAMVIALILCLGFTAFSGMALLATEGHGPLAGTLFAGWSEDFLEEVHEFFANGALMLVLIHVAGVLVSSLLNHENLVRAMITGRKRKRAALDDPDAEEQA